jgi:hypothetical protein
MNRFKGLLAVAGLVAAAAPFAAAHFRLLAPTSWLVEAPLGDPQKTAPCGGPATEANPVSGVVNKAVGGSLLHIKLEETVYHPGHYRIALAVNSREELPADPETVTKEGAKGPQSVSTLIQNPAMPPLLADGLFMHDTKAATPIPWETDVRLPNITCAKCTVQIAQFMADHGRNKAGDFTYHHCVDIAITADPSKPLDTRWPVKK